MAGDQGKQLVGLIAERALFVSADGQSIRAGNHPSVQWLFASLPRHVLEERLPRRHSRGLADTDGDTHDQEWFVPWTDVSRDTQLDQPTQDGTVAGHRLGAEIRQQ